MKNVWVDGSLRDSKWYEQVFEDIRKVCFVSSPFVWSRRPYLQPWRCFVSYRTVPYLTVHGFLGRAVAFRASLGRNSRSTLWDLARLVVLRFDSLLDLPPPPSLFASASVPPLPRTTRRIGSPSCTCTRARRWCWTGREGVRRRRGG